MKIYSHISTSKNTLVLILLNLIITKFSCPIPQDLKQFGDLTHTIERCTNHTVYFTLLYFLFLFGSDKQCLTNKYN